MAQTFTKIGDIVIPPAIVQYIENNDDRLIVEQTSFNAMNGYALGVGTKVKIQRFYEYCPICGYHSITNPNQRRHPMESRHRLERGYETVFYWDNYTRNDSIEEAFNKQITKQEDNYHGTSHLQPQQQTQDI